MIPDALTAVGAQMTVVDAYQTALPDGAQEALVEALQVGRGCGDVYQLFECAESG